MEQKRGEGKQRFWKRSGQAGSRGRCLKKGVTRTTLQTMLLQTMLNILLECIERNTFFKIGDPFNVFLFSIRCRKNMIDWSSLKIAKHVRKSLFSEGWALWAKLDTSRKNMFVITQPSLLNSASPNLFFRDNSHAIMEGLLVKWQKVV